MEANFTDLTGLDLVWLSRAERSLSVVSFAILKDLRLWPKSTMRLVMVFEVDGVGTCRYFIVGKSRGASCSFVVASFAKLWRHSAHSPLHMQDDRLEFRRRSDHLVPTTSTALAFNSFPSISHLRVTEGVGAPGFSTLRRSLRSITALKQYSKVLSIHKSRPRMMSSRWCPCNHNIIDRSGRSTS